MRAWMSIIVCLLTLTVAASVVLADAYTSVWGEEGTGERLTSSWFGNTGLIAVPAATTLRPSSATIDFHRIQRDPEDLDVWGINFGVFDNFEIGGARVDALVTVLGTTTKITEEVGNLKYHLEVAKWFNQPNFPDVALGAWDVTNQLNRTYYVVLTKTLPLGEEEGVGPTITLHVGYGDSDLDQGALDGVFGGIEFSALRYGTIQAEYDGEAFNAAIRYQVNPKFSLDVATLDGDLGYGLTYRSGF